jgi:hypothetical protein
MHERVHSEIQTLKRRVIRITYIGGGLLLVALADGGTALRIQPDGFSCLHCRQQHKHEDGGR